MAERKAAKKVTKTSAGSSFSAEERAAMRERAQELKAEARVSKDRAAGEEALLPKPERAIGERLHALITATAPDLMPRTWYGMPAYARDGKVFCFFTPASKFKERYSTFGFNASANLDDGNMWPTSFALTKMTPAEERKIAALVKKAMS